MAKKVLTLIKLQIPGGQANPAPPVGPALGQHGVNIMEFCKAFNAQTAQENGRIIPVEITVYEDRSFDFITKTPPAAVLIKEALRLEKGSPEPNRTKVGRLVLAHAVHLLAQLAVALAVLHLTSTPIDRAVPSMIFIAWSTSLAFRSGILVSAIVRTWARLIVPTFSLFGSPDPFSMLMACLISTAAGGVLVMKVKERSS